MSEPTCLDATTEKARLRGALGALRGALSESEWREGSALVCAQLLRWIETRSVSGVALYAALEARRELDVTPLDRQLRSRGVRVAYPFLRKTHHGFAWVDDPNRLVMSHGFAQPSADSPSVSPGDLGLIVVPALAANTAGLRLGFGAGFYDQLLPTFCPPAVAVCVVFHQQLANNLPEERHDYPCHAVLTDEGWAKPLVGSSFPP